MTASKKKDMLKCGLIMPISAIDGCSESHWAEVQTIIKEALDDTDFIVELVSDSNESGIIQKRIVQNIYNNDIVVCDVSAKNPNVMFELGMRLAFDKPTIIIKDDKTNYSFDTGQIEHLEYPRDLHYHSIKNFKEKLKIKVVATYEASKKPDYTTFLKHFGPFVVANIEEKEVGKEDFLMEVVSELKDEFLALRRALYAQESNKPKIISSFTKDSKSYPELSWLLQTCNKRNISYDDIKNPESEIFKTLLREYLAETTSDVVSASDFIRLKTTFTEAAKYLSTIKTVNGF